MPRPKKYENPTDYKRKFNEVAYDRISVTIPKGRKQAVEAFAKSRGETVNGLINSLLQREMGVPIDEWKAKPDETNEGEG